MCPVCAASRAPPLPSPPPSQPPYSPHPHRTCGKECRTTRSTTCLALAKASPATKSSVLKHAARVERRLPTFSNHSECAKAWACTATRIVYHDRVAQQFVVRPREGAACRTDLNLSQDSVAAKQLMQRYGPDGWVLHLEGRELVNRSFRHTGGCVYEARSGRFFWGISLYLPVSPRIFSHLPASSRISSIAAASRASHEGTGAGVDESTPRWHRTEFAPMHSAWELLETTNSSRALTPAERCSPWDRWVWPDAEGSTPCSGAVLWWQRGRALVAQRSVATTACHGESI